MGIVKNFDVKEAFLILTEDGNRIFRMEKPDGDFIDVNVIYNSETNSWDLQDVDTKMIVHNIIIAYYAVSDKVLSICYRLPKQNKEERQTVRLWFN